MQIFIMHVGNPGKIDLEYTVSQTRSIEELLEKLPNTAPERSFFESVEFRKHFPKGIFNCWGVPIRAKSSFDRTKSGDIVLFAPEIGQNGGISYTGIIKAICPNESYQASRILWPDTPNDRLFPWLFFFNTEKGFLPWYQFLNDLQINFNWNPRGWYRKIADERFYKWEGSEGYLHHLRDNLGFTFLDKTIEFYESEIDFAIEEIKVITGKPVLRTGQGFLSSVKIRKAIETYAMNQAKLFFKKHGWRVEDVSINNPYDLLCKKKGLELFIEVKGTTTIGEQILLTRNEVQHTKDNYPNVALFIVSRVIISNNIDTNEIEISGGIMEFINPWFIHDENLKPLSYSYEV